MDDDYRDPVEVLKRVQLHLGSRLGDEPLAYHVAVRALELVETNFRDPVRSLYVMMIYLIETRGLKQAKNSLAWDIIYQRMNTMEILCIEDMLGETAKKKGVSCPCWRHPGNYERDMYGTPESGYGIPKRKRVINGKEAAAGEREEA